MSHPDFGDPSKTATRNERPRARTARGIFSKLAEEQADVRARFARLEHAPAAERRGQFPELRDRILAHQEAKLMELYARVRGDERARLSVEQHDRDAGQLHVLVDEVSSIEPDDPSFAEALSRLARAHEQYVQREETEYFPIAHSVLGDEEASRLEAVYTTARQRVLERLALPGTLRA